MKKFLIVLTLSSIFAAQAFAGQDIYVSIVGSKQGAFKGESTVHAGHDNNTFSVNSVDLEMSSPLDAASGLPTGKRVYKPVTITKLFGASSPQILTAAATNEVLTSVRVEFYDVAANGAETLASSIVLTNAAVVSVTQNATLAPGANQVANFQSFSLSFQKITINDVGGGTTFSDDWNVAR